MTKRIELLDKKELAEYLKVSIPTINKMLERREIPGVIRLSDKLIRFRRDRIDEWLESLPSELVNKERYTKKTFKIPGKRGSYSWAGAIRKLEKLGEAKGINLANRIYPLFLFHEFLGIAEDRFIEFLTRSAKEKIIELIPGRSTDIKKGSKVYQALGKPFYSFIYKGLEGD